jgi:hypothetical protein
MKALINGVLYDPADTPVIIILSKDDKRNIARMFSDATVYGSFDSSMPKADRLALIKEAKQHSYKEK